MKEWNDELLSYVHVDVYGLVYKINKVVSRDDYGDGVALVDGKSYETFHELAEDFGIDILNHVR